jgi:hypothetical protein
MDAALFLKADVEELPTLILHEAAFPGDFVSAAYPVSSQCNETQRLDQGPSSVIAAAAPLPPPESAAGDIPPALDEQPAKRRRISVGSSIDSSGVNGSCAVPSPQATLRRPGGISSCNASHNSAASVAGAGSSSSFAALAAGGPYFIMASCLDSADLAQVDGVCRLLLKLNGLPAGPWKKMGERQFFGMELDVSGGFVPFDHSLSMAPFDIAGKASWKSRYEFFQREVPNFSMPFRGREIREVAQPDEVAYCRCRLRTDLLSDCAHGGVYVEVEVMANADNLSLAVVDFEGGGRSSVTFSPETGAVLRERKVRELPRAIEGTYIHLLPAAPPGRRFEGAMGLYLNSTGHLAFFRRWAADSMGNEQHAWETTGFCTDLRWAQGPRLSLCLAFRDNGAYHVRMSSVGQTPPLMPQRSEEAYQENRWNLLYGDDDHPLAI